MSTFGPLLSLVLLVALASVPSIVQTARKRRRVPGMSWRMAWALTAPEPCDRPPMEVDR